jgi:hypothetical protein
MYRPAPRPLMLVFPPRLSLWQYTDNTKGIKPNRVPGIPGDSNDNLDSNLMTGRAGATRGRSISPIGEGFFAGSDRATA